ncbi:hypothetical protein BH20ACI1_BH20ACI1_17020 [soil metagenome]
MSENILVNRREMITKGLKAGAALGLGAMAMGALGNSNSFLSELFIPKALAGIPTGALDFAADPCVLTCAATLGPCYYDTGLVRRDITEAATGKVGLPTRLGFRIVNADTCEPVQNASIDIWHTDNQGVYSAPISTFCNGTDSTVRTQRFGRGIQTTLTPYYRKAREDLNPNSF